MYCCHAQMLVFTARDTDELWFLKGAPRRFFAPNTPARPTSVACCWQWRIFRRANCNPLALAQAISILGAPTRYGTVSLHLNVSDASGSPCVFSARIDWHLHGRGYVNRSQGLNMVVRLRDHAGKRGLDASGARVSGDCSATHAPENRDAVAVTLKATRASRGSCLVCAQLHGRRD